ncbi:putative MFS Superfamily multidrug efflux transporter [Yersinia rohdei]|uniref:Putative MFS Superfamily multidrug efflux transporter n=1 Tax=Yersinia rohdei TaxID=29485 RepID=A0A0U1HT31_YERRO|nr:MFS transporter [Yersinia rohdei]CND93833.1 putative MFS Superfamily multidrug efflux transporter [Yersinia rohdei]CQI90265.1 putative MFS Superfamily multidrug efflux transporter [Yersinia rohdei]CQJ54636.1 putative MFS Superfamily multidrug efflux transporter [Yersinia rohdei]
MAKQSTHRTAAEVKESWVPMITIALAQILMSFNVASLPVALGGMVKSFNVPPTTIATAIVMYSLSVAGFVMLGAKLNQRFGPLVVFRSTVLLFGIAQVMMTFSPNVTVMISAQALSGLAGAALVPALVALIAENYRGTQQATALGALGSARAGAGVAAFLIGGALGTYIGWRPAFGILIVLSVIIFVLSFRLKSDQGRPEVSIDVMGVILAASAIILLSFGFNNLNRWGFGLARDGAPFDLLGFSPAPFMIVLGIVLGQAFVVWTRRRQEQGKTPLLALEVMTSPTEKAAVFAMFAVVALEAMLNFSVPLYIQIVQGSTPMATAIAMMPFNLSVFFSAMLIVRFYKQLTPRKIGRYGFITCTIALLWLAFVVRNNWSEFAVMFGLVVFGLAQGALVTLLFNVLVSASPKELAGDVGSLRGTTNNLANAIGTAVAGALLVGLLSANVIRGVAETPILTSEIQAQVNMDSINFVSNDRLQSLLAQTTATPEQVAEAVRVNEEARLRSLKFGLLIMALLSLLAIFPAGRLPDYLPGELPADNLDRKARK